MELQEDRGVGPYIQSYESSGILIDQVNYTRSVIVMPKQAVMEWSPQSFAALTADSFKIIVDLKPELIILGTGAKQLFPQATLLRVAYEARIAVEVMNTAAACRTYNLLMSEARLVLAALLF